MPKTAIADIIIPTEFEKYAIERTAELSNFGRSGIIMGDPRFDELASMGGRTIQMPFWKDLSGNRQILKTKISAVDLRCVQVRAATRTSKCKPLQRKVPKRKALERKELERPCRPPCP